MTPGVQADNVTYAGFRYRLIAGLVDLLVFLPILTLDVWLRSTSRTAALVLIVPMTALYAIYNIYFHARWGQTPGKMVAGIRVVKLSGESIGWREAFLRSSVDVAFALLFVIGSYMSLMSMTDAEYQRLPWLERQAVLDQRLPVWYAWVGRAETGWIWSEVVVVLFNRRRRALHDFIAGTVVLVNRKREPSVDAAGTSP
jgi:uncharacterized RDD family membrane protein YckC